MKILKTLILLFVLAGLSIVADMINEKSVIASNSKITETNLPVDSLRNRKVRTNYAIDIEYVNVKNSFSVEEIIEWKNIDNIKIDTLYLNLPKNVSKIDSKNSQFDYKINSLKINGNESEYEFVEFRYNGFIDATLAKVIVPNGIGKNEVVTFEIHYDIVFSEEKKITDTQFLNFENWYVTITPYLNDEFISYPLHKYIEPFLEYSNFNVKIKIPNNFDIAVSGELEEDRSGNDKTFSCSAKGITRFNWFAFSELSKFSKTITIAEKEIAINLFIEESKDGYVERYFDATEKYLNSLADFMAYPLNKFAIIDLPNGSKVKNKSYPNMIALNSDLISPVKTQKLEYKLAFLIAEQYFGNFTTSNYLEESWLTKGISSYLAERLVRTHFGDLYSYFTIADYYPIYGLHFMSYSGIPIIYTISEQVIPEGARFLTEYYSNLAFTDLSTPTYLQPNYDAYKTSSIVKPHISLLTLEKMIGYVKFKNELIKYFRNHLYEYPKSIDFMKAMTENCSQEEKDFYNNLFTSDKTFDYAIKYVKKGNGNKYDIMVERVESGVAPIILNVNREVDTLKLYWDGKAKFKVFTIHSETEIISAELDSGNKNLLDLNFANNSYMVEEQYWGSVSYATRVFFWFQNALMLIGGKG